MTASAPPSPSFVVHAPGKLVLVGEYAVLDGGDALVLAINRGVSCRVWLGGEALQIETPDADDRFVRPALLGQSGRFQFEDWNPVSLPTKPGFGGSAAACVAACVAAGRPATDAFALHHLVQGSGSGVDVAAAVSGGLLHFHAGLSSPRPGARAPVVIYSGAAARTGPRVQIYQAWSGRAAFVADSNRWVEAFREHPIQALQGAGDRLETMAEAAGLPYRTPALDRIRALARDHGGAAKASGAGGGDCAIALFDDADAECAFIRACEADGLPVIPVEVAPGARRDNGAHA